MANERGYDNEYLAICADVLKVFTLLFHGELKAKRYHPNLIICMTWAFQPNCSLHNHYFQMSEQELIELTTKSQTWRAELQVGQMVDAFVLGDEKKKTENWLQA